jgi:hypothetical protein
MDKLQVEIVIEYLSLLDYHDLLKACKIDKRLNTICKEHKDFIAKKALENLFNKKIDVKDSLLIYKTLEKRDLLKKKYQIPKFYKNPEIMHPYDGFYDTLIFLRMHDNQQVNIIKKFICDIFDGVVYRKYEVFDSTQQVYSVVFDKNINQMRWLNKYFGKLYPKKEFYFLLDNPPLTEDFNNYLENNQIKGYKRDKNETRFKYFET